RLVGPIKSELPLFDEQKDLYSTAWVALRMVLSVRAGHDALCHSCCRVVGLEVVSDEPGRLRVPLLGCELKQPLEEALPLGVRYRPTHNVVAPASGNGGPTVLVLSVEVEVVHHQVRGVAEADLREEDLV